MADEINIGNDEDHSMDEFYHSHSAYSVMMGMISEQVAGLRFCKESERLAYLDTIAQNVHSMYGGECTFEQIRNMVQDEYDSMKLTF